MTLLPFKKANSIFISKVIENNFLHDDEVQTTLDLKVGKGEEVEDAVLRTIWYYLLLKPGSSSLTRASINMR